MTYYKNKENKVFAFNDNEEIATDELIKITKSEANELRFKPLTIVQKSLQINKAIQTHLDNKAKEFRYDNMMSARSYAGYINPFQDEAQKLAIWASNCWVKAGEIEADVKAGNRAMPTIDEVLAELPAY